MAFLAFPGQGAAAIDQRVVPINPIYVALDGDFVAVAAEEVVEGNPIIRFIEITEGEFSPGRVERAVEAVFAELSPATARDLPEFMANIAALGLSREAFEALAAALLARIEASDLSARAKSSALAAVRETPRLAPSSRATLPADGACDAAHRFDDPDCPPVTTGPSRR